MWISWCVAKLRWAFWLHSMSYYSDILIDREVVRCPSRTASAKLNNWRFVGFFWLWGPSGLPEVHSSCVSWFCSTLLCLRHATAQGDSKDHNFIFRRLKARFLSESVSGTFFRLMDPEKWKHGSSNISSLKQSIMEVENHRFVEENSLPRGHVPLPFLLEGISSNS